jgi:hypothetical protein
VTAALDSAGPRITAALETAQAAAGKAAADLGPQVEAARKAAAKALSDDVAPRLAAARDAVSPALETARGTLAAATAEAGKKASKAATDVKRRTGRVPEPRSRRWPWLLLLAAAAGGAAFALLRRRRGDDELWVSPAGDGPVPSYREDPVPSSSESSKTPSESGTLSSGQTAPGDAPPPDTDLGMQPQQMSNPGVTEGDTPEPSSSSANDPDSATIVNEPAGGVTEGPAAAKGKASVDPGTDATNDTDSDLGPAGTPLANRGQEPGNGTGKA